MSIIGSVLSAPKQSKSPWSKLILLLLTPFVPLKQIPKLKICHQLASENPEVIVGEINMVDSDVPYPEEDEDGGGSGLGNCYGQDMEEEDGDMAAVEPTEAVIDPEAGISQELV